MLFYDMEGIYMQAWKDIVQCISKEKRVDVYPNSVHEAGGSECFVARIGGKKFFVVCGGGEGFELFNGKEACFNGVKIKFCEMDNENAKIARKLFPHASPVSFEGRDTTLGLGDRLGLASPGHLRLLQGKDVFPVLAQQSIRELNLTGRTYEDVLAAATWAVIQEGYKGGYGADGDHLKKPDEVRMALDTGFTMITLDCSEHINNEAAHLGKSEIENIYRDSISAEEKRALEEEYVDRELCIKGGITFRIEPDEFKKIVLVYYKAVKFAIAIYNEFIKNCARKIDFEVSIDETLVPTSVEAHYFVAAELVKAGVRLASMAPRFSGEFQKGIDYKGNTEVFADEFEQHFMIAEHFGYRISVHSGSDKFSVFPIIGQKTGGRFHLKTAGTNWLEAVRIIAVKNPALYRKMHDFAIKSLPEAKKYYHIFTSPEMVPRAETLDDSQLPDLMDIEEARQALHVTYGIILQAREDEGKWLFRDEFFDTLDKNEDEYYKALEKHIGKHLSLLGKM